MSVLYMQIPANPDAKRFYSSLLNVMDIPTPSAATRISEVETEAWFTSGLTKVTLLKFNRL